MKYVSRSKSAAVNDIDIDITDILGQKYRYRIDIGHGDIDPSLHQTTVGNKNASISGTVRDM